MAFLSPTPIATNSNLSSSTINATIVTEIQEFFNGTTAGADIKIAGDMDSAEYKISSTSVLSSTTLGAGVLNSSLTSVGTLTSLTVAGTTDSASYLISAVSVLTSTTLGAAVVNSSLTNVGTLTSLTVSGTTDSGSYLISATSVLTSTTLGSGVVNSSLTSVGTLTSLTVAGIITGDQVRVDNLSLNGNTFSSVDVDGNLILDPNGTGDIILAAAIGGEVLVGNTSGQTNPMRLHNPGTGGSSGIRLQLTDGDTGVTATSGIIIGTNSNDLFSITNHQGEGFEFNNGAGATFKVDSSDIVNFGTHSVIGAETVTGFITMKDIGGTTRKLAVVS